MSIPSFGFNLGSKHVEVRGLNPEDIGLQNYFSKFSFNPSLDFEGGTETILKIDIEASDDEKKLIEFERTRNIIATRLQSLRLGDFNLKSYYNLEEDDFQLHLRTSDPIDQAVLGILLTNGNVGLWIEDSEIEVSEEEAQLNPFFAGRRQLEVNNSNILSVGIISDSRIYIQDANEPNEHGFEIKFDQNAVPELYEAALSRVPILITIDNSPVAVQATGQLATETDYGDTILAASLFTDEDLLNSILRAVMATPTINGFVDVAQSYSVGPELGNGFRTEVMANFAIGFVMLCCAFGVFFKRRSIGAIVSLFFYITLSIALFQLLNSILSIAVIIGFMIAIVFFVIFLLLLNQRILVRTKQGLTDNELFGVLNTTKDQHQKVFIFLIALGLVLQFWGTVDFYHFGFGLGIGAVAGYLAMILAIPSVYPYIYLKLLANES